MTSRQLSITRLQKLASTTEKVSYSETYVYCCIQENFCLRILFKHASSMQGKWRKLLYIRHLCYTASNVYRRVKAHFQFHILFNRYMENVAADHIRPHKTLCYCNVYLTPKVTLHISFLNKSSFVLNCNKASIGSLSSTRV